MRDNILRYLRENGLIAPGATLVCAVSERLKLTKFSYHTLPS